MKRLLSILLVLTMVLSLSACSVELNIGEKDKADMADTVKEKVDSEKVNKGKVEETTIDESVTEETEVDKTEVDKTEVAETEVDEPVVEETKSEETEVEEDANINITDIITNINSELQDGKWINFDNMQVAISGVTVTLGETTLQELIDAGITFDEDDIIEADNTLKANYESSGFKITLDEYWSAQVYVGNYTDEAKVMKELPIVSVYLPNKPEKTQDIVEFAFPLTLTEDELISTCGEPQDKDLADPSEEYGSNYYKYTKESTKYFGDLKYDFTFTKGDLKYITISWLP